MELNNWERARKEESRKERERRRKGQGRGKEKEREKKEYYAQHLLFFGRWLISLKTVISGWFDSPLSLQERGERE